MGFLLLEGRLRNEDWKVGVFDTELLDFLIEELLDFLPNTVGPWTNNVASGDVVILDHLGFFDYLEIRGEEVGCRELGVE